jgi:ethanolaminephosphotransferase
MQPFWRLTLNLFPEWMAPNLITLLGFLAILLSYILTYWYSPTLSEPLPQWLYIFNAFCLFFYQTLDAIDGKQARRTETSSALGELFDHGCDAMSTVFCALTMGAALRTGSDIVMYVNLIMLMCTFYMSQWDVYFNGILDLWYLNVTEAQFFGMMIQILPAIYGPHFWLTPCTIYSITLPLAYWALIPSILTCIGFSISAILNVGKFASENGADALYCSVLYTVPLCFTTGLFSLWVYLSPQLLTNYIHLTCICVGFLFCNFVGRFVTSRVCKLPYSIFYFNMIPLPVAIMNALTKGSLINEVLLLKIYAAISVLSYLHFCWCIILLMTAHLKIRAFKIPYPPPSKIK